MEVDTAAQSAITRRLAQLRSAIFVYRGIGIPATREGVKFAYVAMIPLVALTIFYYVDVRNRGQILAGQIEAHRTDFTVFTEAGAAFFDGRDPYRVTNPRGWFYLYPPLFALMVSPLSCLDSQSQVLVWYLVSIALGFGCYAEARRVWLMALGSGSTARGDCSRITSFTIGIGICTGLAVAFPALDCLQRGQVGIALLYAMLLGLRLSLAGSWPRVWLGGLVLAWPVVVKLIPALAVACLVLRFWALAWGRGITSGAVSRATALTLGVVVGAFLFLFFIPGAAVGWTRNLQLLQEWRLKVATNDNIGRDAMFQIDSTSNQSLTNAVLLFSDTLSGMSRVASTDLHRFAIDKAIADRHRSDRAARLVADSGRLAVLLLLMALTIKYRRENQVLQEAAIFGLSSLSILLVSPLAWGHYFVLVLPAALFVPCWMHRAGHHARACLAAAALPSIVICHYALKSLCGPVGLLGLGTGLWFLAVCGWLVLSDVSFAGDRSEEHPQPRAAAFVRPLRFTRRRARRTGAIVGR
jgi:hypothetical protein